MNHAEWKIPKKSLRMVFHGAFVRWPQDDTPNACFTDIAAEDLKEAERYGDLMGVKALAILDKAQVGAIRGEACGVAAVLPAPIWGVRRKTG